MLKCRPAFIAAVGAVVGTAAGLLLDVATARAEDPRVPVLSSYLDRLTAQADTVCKEPRVDDVRESVVLSLRKRVYGMIAETSGALHGIQTYLDRRDIKPDETQMAMSDFKSFVAVGSRGSDLKNRLTHCYYLVSGHKGLPNDSPQANELANFTRDGILIQAGIPLGAYANSGTSTGAQAGN